MNLRRYALVLVCVALLTFAIGVAAAMVLGQVNPLSRFRERSRRAVAGSLLCPAEEVPVRLYGLCRTAR